MKMTVRACVIAVVLVLLGASSVFAQQPTATSVNSYNVGAPAGSVYGDLTNGPKNFNLALNAEGNRELGAPVSLCAGTPGGAAAAGGGGTTRTFNVGDVFVIEYKTINTAQNDPVFVTQGALGGANLAIVQNGVGVGVTATASAAMFTPPTIAGAVPATPQALVTISITGAPGTASGINCITIQGMRFDLGNTTISTTNGAQGVKNGSVITATVTEPNLNGTGVAAAAPVLALPNTDPYALGTTPAGGMNPGFPTFATNVVGSAYSTFGTLGAVGLANATGYTTGGLGASGAASKSGLGASFPNATINGSTKNGTVSIQEAPIPASTTTVAGMACLPSCAGTSVPLNLPIVDGGGLFRGYVTAGPDVTTWLNLSGATTGTQFIITVTGMPTGSSVVFASTASSSSNQVVMNFTGGGTISAPGGSVTYTTTINEGIATTISTTAAIGPSAEIAYTVTPGTAAAGGSGATFSITLAPVAGASAIPTYSTINGTTIKPDPSPGVAPTTLFTVSSNQTTKAFPYVTYTGGSTAADYDTGLVLDNTGRGVSVVNGTSCFQVGAGLQPPTGCSTNPVGATGNLGGQDGPFTVFFITSGTTVASIRSTATCSGGGAFPGSAANSATKYNGLTSGALKQGDYWVALASQVLSCAGITGAWSGQVSIVADIPGTTGFGFISQFFNASGGATMGYVAP